LNDRVVALDLLRGVAACAVAIPHFFVYWGSGGIFTEGISIVAVEVFFVLSGFVLGPQILLILDGTVKRALLIFLVRRWMRTIPAYIVALILVSTIFSELGSGDFWRYSLYIQNLFGQHNKLDYYPVAWSLSVEEWFYVIFPLFILASSRLSAKRSVAYYAAVATLFIALVTMGRVGFAGETSWGSTVRRVVVFRLDSVAYGFLLYLVTQYLPARRRLWWPVGGLLFCATSIFILLQLVENSGVARAIYPLIAAGFGAFSILVFLKLDRHCQGPMVRRVSEVSGKLSYSIYLFHLICIYVVKAALGSSPFVVQFIAYFIGTAIIATMSSYLFEQPILLLRPKYR
jgi:peptidoglycan/LPS O-acetylase OafA/YrhL